MPLLLLLLALPACGRDGAPDTTTPIPTPSSMPTVTSLPEVAESPQPAPTATLILPLATTPAPTPTICPFAYFFQPAPAACPAAAPVNSFAAEQPFEGGVMIWLEATDSILVLFDDGRWSRFEDTWSEGEAESDAAIVPPDGRFQPIRGFGKQWRERPEVREGLGWALGVELGYEATFQEGSLDGETAGAYGPSLTYLLTYNGQVFALVRRAPDQGDWVLAADNR